MPLGAEALAPNQRNPQAAVEQPDPAAIYCQQVFARVALYKPFLFYS
jgi:hypothetical protein